MKHLNHPGCSYYADGTSQKTDKIIAVVNANNEMVGSAPWSQVYSDKLWHRVSYVFIYNPKKAAFAV